MDTGLSGKTVLVTGASGGIGWTTAQALRDEGCRVVLHGNRNAGALEERARDWPNAIALAADVGSAAEVEDMFARAVSLTGGVDVCVANAGIWPPDAKLLHEMDPLRIQEVIQVNLLGAIYTARAFLRQVESTARRGSALVLVGSTAGRFGEAGHTEYAVSKAGLRGLMLSYKNEVVAIDPGGRCNLVEPGWTISPMTAEHLEDDAAIVRTTRTMALRRIARSEDVAAAIVMLASPRLSAHLSGQTLTVAGGMEGRLLWEPEQIDPAAIRERLR